MNFVTLFDITNFMLMYWYCQPNCKQFRLLLQTNDPLFANFGCRSNQFQLDSPLLETLQAILNYCDLVLQYIKHYFHQSLCVFSCLTMPFKLLIIISRNIFCDYILIFRHCFFYFQLMSPHILCVDLIIFNFKLHKQPRPLFSLNNFLRLRAVTKVQPRLTHRSWNIVSGPLNCWTFT